MRSDLDTVASIAVDPTDNRAVIITAATPGPVQCHVTCGSNTLTINVTVQDIDASAISATFDPPVAR